MAKFVALLRGINVGGKHKLPMAELRDAFELAGATTVETYIQSGNVVFESPAREGPRIAHAVSEWVASDKGFPAPIVLRSASAWATVIAGNPFVAEAAENPKRVHVALLDRAPTKAARSNFDPDCRFGERWTLAKDALYVDYAGGLARSKLSVAYIDRVLGCIATGRNWRTMLALRDRLGN